MSAALTDASPAGYADISKTCRNIYQTGYEKAFDASKQIWLLASSCRMVRSTSPPLIVLLAAQHRLPAIYAYQEFVAVDSQLAYGGDTADVTRQRAEMTAKVLRTQNRATYYCQQSRFELVLNRARSLGLEFPASLLAVADEVIE